MNQELFCRGHLSYQTSIPIENVWALMKSGLREKTVTGGNDELFNVLGIVTMESHISTFCQ